MRERRKSILSTGEKPPFVSKKTDLFFCGRWQPVIRAAAAMVLMLKMVLVLMLVLMLVLA